MVHNYIYNINKYQQDLLGQWLRFEYCNNGSICYVYCRSLKDFSLLFNSWVHASKFSNGKYHYYIDKFTGDVMNIDEVRRDREKLKSYILCDICGYIQ